MPAADGITFDAHRARYSLAASGGGSHPTDERMRTFPRTAPGEDIIPDRLGGQNRWPLTLVERSTEFAPYGLRAAAGSANVRVVCGRNSVVECQLPKLDVAGSTPVARSL